MELDRLYLLEDEMLENTLVSKYYPVTLISQIRIFEPNWIGI